VTKSLLLIDGNSIINRAYFGIAGRSSMKASDNTPTGALYAFMNMYYKFYEETKPDYACVCFDLKAPTFRHEKYDDYKATRKPMPDDLAVQMPILKESAVKLFINKSPNYSPRLGLLAFMLRRNHAS